ncbi:class I SAM-dependent methyltransferase [Prochlorococcus marinus]|uniref:Methyltransferase type 11 domain-containing protein n=1 Tax=Prochlorococcus marinus (strain MIT 9303) TaxID=59922 RepID=A2CDW5_PROM3|nr:class I SAM-dependent methyltransferase [Prochlorococcus marinus]ABM79675.1 Hypothetical protein P9303_29451 [Prochlorococcus marinus str. MIT 9303]
MKTDWDYSDLANAYLKRPDYSDNAIDAMLSIVEARKLWKFCDVGAGVAHLTLMLLERGFEVVPVEPNDAMRTSGINRTKSFSQVNWKEGTGEVTGEDSNLFDMVTFGSSFNVCDRQLALKETARILKPNGWFACMWNHRDLNDPIQKNIELIIKEHVPVYGYGTRREDQTSVINHSKLFGSVVHVDSRIMHEQTIDECVEAWRSHATLERQAGIAFPEVVNLIQQYLNSLGTASIKIPYSTNIWLAKLL